MEHDKPRPGWIEYELDPSDPAPFLEALQYVDTSPVGEEAKSRWANYVFHGVFEHQPEAAPSLYESLTRSEYAGHRQMAAIGIERLLEVDRPLALTLWGELIGGPSPEVAATARESFDAALATDLLSGQEAVQLVRAYTLGELRRGRADA